MDFFEPFCFLLFFITIPLGIYVFRLWHNNHRWYHQLQDETSKRMELADALREAQETAEEARKAEKAILAEIEQHRSNVRHIMEDKASSMPWLAGMMADFLTYDLEVEAKKLDWGSNVQRQKKIASLREIRKEAQEKIAEAKVATYQLEYLRTLYPEIDEVLESDFQKPDLTVRINDTPSDPCSEYLTKEEWLKLSQNERDQLALDRYVESHKKSSWQIGRDYELSVAYEYSKKGYAVTTYGSIMRLEDMGRDLICEKGPLTLIIQCKYWSQTKTIHEKHIFQLYGSMVSYQIEHPYTYGEIKGVFITNTTLSETARKVANHLKISVVENHAMVDFPRIKCNIGHGEYGQAKIYHLPMDDQYDNVQIKNPGEFYAFTVQEATTAGFRRAYHWHGQ